MSQDFNANIKGLEKILGKLPDNLKDILSGLVKEDSGDTTVNANLGSHSVQNELFSRLDKGLKSDMGLNMETIKNLSGLMNSMQNSKDEKIELISALTPFLRPSRQDKALSLVKVLKFSTLFKNVSTLYDTQGENKFEDED